MSFYKQLLEKQKNPLGWLFALLFFILFCFGFWHHNWAIIVISLIGFAGSMWYFPKPAKRCEWLEECVQIASTWIDRPFDTEKWIVTGVGGIAFLLLLVGLWGHAGFLIFIGIIGIIAVKGYVYRSVLLNLFKTKKSKRDKPSDKK